MVGRSVPSMSDKETASAAILSAIATLAKDAETGNFGPDGSFKLAAAANQLAEARAWLVSQAQPHGGTTVSSD